MTSTEKSTQPRVRFAPSPTGYLHLGGARTALFNWLFARHHGGTFILRIEDTDLERSRAEMTAQVLEGLRWLGLDWDEGPGAGGEFGPYFQSERLALHREAAQRLMAEGKAYHCYMTSAELEARREAAIAAQRPFRYEGWHRNLTREQVAAFEAEGRRPAIRLRVDPPADSYLVDDLIKGPTHFPVDSVDDFILLRSDGTPSFHLANAVDDAGMQVTHVIRGEDHLPNTTKHILLAQALGFAPPRYGHVPMILGADRSKLSKRHGAVSVMDYATEGYFPAAMVNMLALLGWSPEDGQEILNIDELVARFDIDRCGKSPSIFDMDKLRHLNGLRIRAMSNEQLTEALKPYAAQLEDILPPEKISAAAALLQKELVTLGDFVPFARGILETPNYSGELRAEPALARATEVAASIQTRWMPLSNTWTGDLLKSEIKAAGKELGIKGKELFFPIRAALTGTLHGPELDGILTLLGSETTLARLAAFASWWNG